MNAPEPPVLTAAEAAVLGELGHLAAGSADQRMTRTYRRMLELARSDDEIDGVLAAHLARELMAAAPVALGLGTLELGHFDAGTRVRELAATWPSDTRDGDLPEQTAIEVRRLINDADAASARAGEPARTVFAARSSSTSTSRPCPDLPTTSCGCRTQAARRSSSKSAAVTGGWRRGEPSCALLCTIDDGYILTPLDNGRTKHLVERCSSDP